MHDTLVEIGPVRMSTEATAPCRAACPLGGDIASWIASARAGHLRLAFDILSRHNPLPAVCGRVCHHPCETACSRGGFDEPLAICGLERLVGDEALAQRWKFAAPQIARSERVAVVGGGPAGLSAAYQLRRHGYAVSLFEAQRQLGGQLRHGIPAFRLPRTVLDGEIDRIVALGIELHCEAPLADPDWLERLRADHDAVFLATGAARSRPVAWLDCAQPWVSDAAAYLAAVNAGTRPALGRRVVIVGGGSLALDAARCARRAGHPVTVLCMESAAQIAARREDIAETLEEGISLIAGARLVGVSETAAGLRLECARVNVDLQAWQGQREATTITAGRFFVPADTVMPALGQDPDITAFQAWLESAPWPTTYVVRPPRGLSKVAKQHLLKSDAALLEVDARQATSLDRVYAGGDLTSTARGIGDAIATGRRAALAIDRALRRAGPEAIERKQRVPTLATIDTSGLQRQARVHEPKLGLARRLASSSEVQLGLDFDEAMAETRRCFSCGLRLR